MAYKGDVVVRFPRPMEGKEMTPIFSSLQNGQFHHRRLESLDHLIVVIFRYIVLLFKALRSHFRILKMQYYFYSLFCTFPLYFASTLYMYTTCLTSFDDKTVSMSF